MRASLGLTGSLAWEDASSGLPVAGIVVIAALVAGLIAVVLAALAALVPALLVQRLPLARLIAQE